MPYMRDNHARSEPPEDPIMMLGNELQINPYLARRRIRGISWPLLVFILSVLFIFVGVIASKYKNDFIHDLSNAFGGFCLGFLVSPMKAIRKRIQTINKIMRRSDGRMSIFGAIFASFEPKYKFVLGRGERLFPSPMRKAYIEFRFPHLVRRWKHYFRRGIAKPQSAPLPWPYLPETKDCPFFLRPLRSMAKAWNTAYVWRRRLLLYRTCKYICELSPFLETLEKLTSYTSEFLSREDQEKLRRLIIDSPMTEHE